MARQVPRAPVLHSCARRRVERTARRGTGRFPVASWPRYFHGVPGWLIVMKWFIMWFIYEDK